MPAARSILGVCGIPFLDGAVVDEKTRRHRLVFSKEIDPTQLAAVLEKHAQNYPAIALLDHTGRHLLKQKPQMAVAQPILRTGNQGVEVHPVAGDVAALMDETLSSGVPSQGAAMLRGTKQEIVEAVHRAVGAGSRNLSMDAPRPNSRRIHDIPEQLPQAVVASDALAVIQQRIEQRPRATPEQVAEVENAFAGKPVTFSPLQAEGVAFMAGREASILADDTGGGKTIMAAAAASMAAPEGTKVLVVCPPNLIPQWVEKMAKFFPQPEPAGLPVSPPPHWLDRLSIVSSSARPGVTANWQRIRSRFVFLPESDLTGGVEYRHGKIRKAKDHEETARSASAQSIIEGLLREPISTLVVDESHGMRVAGPKYELLSSLRQNKVKGAQMNIERVILCTATPIHRAAPDLFSILGLLGHPKFQKMKVAEFCKEYCERAIEVKNGEAVMVPAQAPYGYTRFKDDKLPEITKLVSDYMLCRRMEELAPDKTLPKIIESPLPYAPSPTLGVRLPGMKQAGKLVSISGEALAIASDPSAHYQVRHRAVASAKVAATVAKAREISATLPEGQKVVIFTEHIAISREISESLHLQGMRSFRLSSAEMMDPSGRAIRSKAEFVQAVNEDRSAPVVVMTAGAGGTGIDGLHRSARTAVFNDFSPLAGKSTQAEGRVWRVFQEGLPEDKTPVRAIYMVADCKHDTDLYHQMIERRHEAEFIREQGMMQLLDGPEKVAALETERLENASRLLAIIGEKPELESGRLTALLSEQDAMRAAEDDCIVEQVSEATLAPISLEAELKRALTIAEHAEPKFCGPN
jgi:superfamily II DNA or RNA helicase